VRKDFFEIIENILSSQRRKTQQRQTMTNLNYYSSFKFIEVRKNKKCPANARHFLL